MQGRSELLEAISKKLKKENKINAPTERIIVTTGGTEVILLTLMVTIDPGEHVLIPDPGFITFRPATELLNGFPVSIPLKMESNFEPNIDDLKKIIHPKKTRMMIINTPSNPLGAIYSKKKLEELADFAVDNNLLILSDEAYEDFVYKGRHVSIGSLNGMSKYVLSLFTFSKTYGMTGFRVGYAVGPREIINAMKNIHICTTLCAPTISQRAAYAALRGSKVFFKKILKEYNKRRKFIVKRLNEINGFTPYEPSGAFYVFSKYDFKMKSVKLSEWLIKNAKVAVFPGSDFGRFGEGFVRFSYATNFKLIKKAMDRIEKAVKRLR